MNEKNNPNLIDCPVCGQQVSSSAASCPHCGHPLKIAKAPKKKSLAKRIITALIIIFVVVPLVIYVLYSVIVLNVGIYTEKGKSGLQTIVCELPEDLLFERR